MSTAIIENKTCQIYFLKKSYRNASHCFLVGAEPRIFYCDCLIYEYGVIRKQFVTREWKHDKGKADKLFFATLFPSLWK